MTKPSTYASYFVLSLVKFCDPIERRFMLPRSKLMYMPQINNYSYIGDTLKHVSITSKINTPCFKTMISLALLERDRKAMQKVLEKKNGTHEGPKV